MNQAEILKRLLAEYRLKGGDLGNVAAATVYLNLHKPVGVGRVNEVICGAVIRQMGVTPAPAPKPAKAMLDTPPEPTPNHYVVPSKPWPRIAPEPAVIAEKTVSFPQKAREVYEAHEAIYSEKPAETPNPVAASAPPADLALPPERTQVLKPTTFLERLKFWKRK